MSPWFPVQDISLTARPADGASRADSQSRTACELEQTVGIGDYVECHDLAG